MPMPSKGPNGKVLGRSASRPSRRARIAVRSGRIYPPAANLYIAAGIKVHLVSHGLHTPVTATGKINTPELAETILNDCKADMIGMARPLLADPDWPRKVQAGHFDRVIRCCYANVCKAKDERFQTVTCFLWPRGLINAPDSADTAPPTWPVQGASLRADTAQGRVSLKWNAAIDAEGVYGYDIWRSESGSIFERIDAVPGGVTAYHDGMAVSGVDYRYYVKAYDFGGNRSEGSATLAVSLSG
jgi:hypothetical protein